MRIDQTNSSNSIIKFAGQTIVLATGLCVFHPSTAGDLLTNRQNNKHTKQVNQPYLAISPSVGYFDDQVFPATDGGDPEDEFDYDLDIDIEISPISEFTVRANVISIEEGTQPPVFIEDIFYID